MHKPLISVVVPVYNKKSHIIQTLETVRAQTFKEWECLIIDDGSTDGSANLILNSFENEFKEAKFMMKTIDNSGQSVARNTGIQLSKGKYIALLDGDDLWNSKKLEWQYELLEMYPQCDLALGAYSISQNGAPIRIVKHSSGSQMIKDWLYLRGFGGAFESVALVRSEITKQALFDDDFSTSAGLELFLRILDWNPIFVYDSRVQFSYTKYSGQWHTDYFELERNLRSVANRHFPSKIDIFEGNLAAYASLIRIKSATKNHSFLAVIREFKLGHLYFILSKATKYFFSVFRGLFYSNSEPKLYSGK